MANNEKELQRGWIEADFNKCIEIPNGPFIKIPKNKYLQHGKFPIIDQGSEFISGHTNDENKLFKGGLPIIIFGDHTRLFKFVDFDFAVGADGTKILRAKKGIDPEYLFFYLKSLKLPSRGYSRHYRYLKENKILIAPLLEQIRIVNKIEILFDCLLRSKESLNKIPLILKKFQQALLFKAFSGELTKEWREQQEYLEPASKLLERINEERKKKFGRKYKELEPIDTSDLPELPKGWVWTSLESILSDIQPGFASGKKDIINGLQHLRMNNIDSDCNINLDIVRTVPNNLGNEKYILKKGDILICHTNSQKLIGKTAIFNIEGRYAFSNHLTLLCFFNNTIKSEWIWYYLKNLWQKGYYTKRCKQWVNQATIERHTLLEIPIPIPSLKEQAYAVKKIQDFFTKANFIEKMIDNVKKYSDILVQSILEKAFRGKLLNQHSEN